MDKHSRDTGTLSSTQQMPSKPSSAPTGGRHVEVSLSGLDAIDAASSDDPRKRFALKAAYLTACSGRQQGMPISTWGHNKVTKLYGIPERTARMAMTLLFDLVHPDGTPLLIRTDEYNRQNRTAYLPRIRVYRTKIVPEIGESVSLPFHLFANTRGRLTRAIGADEHRDVKAARLEVLLALYRELDLRWWGVHPSLVWYSFELDAEYLDEGIRVTGWDKRTLMAKQRLMDSLEDQAHSAIRHILSASLFTTLVVATDGKKPMYPAYSTHQDHGEITGGLIELLRQSLELSGVERDELPFELIAAEQCLGILQPVDWPTLKMRSHVEAQMLEQAQIIRARLEDEHEW